MSAIINTKEIKNLYGHFNLQKKTNIQSYNDLNKLKTYTKIMKKLVFKQDLHRTVAT